MKRWMAICCLALVTISGVAEAHRGGWRHGGGRVGVYIGAPIVFGAPYYSPYYYYPPAYSYGPPVVREYFYEDRLPPPAVEPQSPTWYYCTESERYYPYVQDCPGGWTSVPAKPPAGRQ